MLVHVTLFELNFETHTHTKTSACNIIMHMTERGDLVIAPTRRDVQCRHTKTCPIIMLYKCPIQLKGLTAVASWDFREIQIFYPVEKSVVPPSSVEGASRPKRDLDINFEERTLKEHVTL